VPCVIRVSSTNAPSHIEGRGTVEVACRLVGEHHERLVTQRPGDRDPLTLPT
jgi:hypothetical protein